MGTEILSFGNLQHELDEARSSLKGVDESIKRLIGRDPSELPPRNVQKRPTEEKGRPVKTLNRVRNFAHENEEPPIKRRSNISVFKRLSDKVPDDDHHLAHKGLISKVIVTPKEIPSREQALEAQNKDEKFRARNKRMFGALLGTLQKFQQEESKLKQREQKRAELEKKIEDHEIKEKEEVRKEKQELFFNRKKKQAEIKVIELKMLRMKEYASWEQNQKPRKMTDQTKKSLEESNKNLQEMLDTKKKQIADELQHIEDKMKKNFDYKFGHKEEKEEEHQENNSRRRHDDDDKDQEDQFDDIQDSKNSTQQDIINDKNDKTEQPEAKEVEEITKNENNHEVQTENNVNTDLKDELAKVEENESVINDTTVATSEYNPETIVYDTATNVYDPATSAYDPETSVYDPADCIVENNPETEVTVTDYQYTEFQSDYNSQEFQNNYNNISVQMGNFGPQTSD